MRPWGSPLRTSPAATGAPTSPPPSGQLWAQGPGLSTLWPVVRRDRQRWRGSQCACRQEGEEWGPGRLLRPTPAQTAFSAAPWTSACHLPARAAFRKSKCVVSSVTLVPVVGREHSIWVFSYRSPCCCCHDRTVPGCTNQSHLQAEKPRCKEICMALVEGPKHSGPSSQDLIPALVAPP